MAELSIEIGEDLGINACSHCGSEYSTVRGFIYDSGDAYALYFAALYPDNTDHRMALDIAMGDWEDAAPAAARLRVALEVWPQGDNINMHIHDRHNWNWSDSETFGRLLGRDEALSRADIGSYLEVADFIVTHDPRLQPYLDAAVD
jgi:hypothetical protein